MTGYVMGAPTSVAGVRNLFCDAPERFVDEEIY